MPKVSISGSGFRQFTGGINEFEVEATSFRRLIHELERRFPGGREVAVGGAAHESVIGRRSEKVIMLYSEFLDALDDKDKRNRLSSELYEEMPEFKDLRLKGREFKEELLSSLSGTYEVAHPIHKALLL